MTPIRNQFDRFLGNPQVVILISVILTFLLVVVLFGNILMPVFAGLAIAYLLEGPVQRLQRIGMRRIFAVLLVFLMFMTVMAFLVFGVVGARALAVHAKDDYAASFYRHFGFMPSPTDKKHLLLLIKDIRDASNK